MRRCGGRTPSASRWMNSRPTEAEGETAKGEAEAEAEAGAEAGAGTKAESETETVAVEISPRYRDFLNWLDGVKAECSERGVSANTIAAVFDRIEPLPEPQVAEPSTG